MELLLEPLSYGFVLRGLAGGMLAALACALLSAFVVWRGMAFVGDALAHAILPGIVVAYVLGMSLFLGALGAAVLAVVGIGLISGRRRLKEDTAIGVVFSSFFALGVLLMSRITTYQDLSHILFGNILGVGVSDLVVMSGVVLFTVIVLALSHKELLVASFDPAHSVAIGLSPTAIRYLLLFLLATTTVVAIQTVGVILVLSLLVTPAAAASMVSKRLSTITTLSVAMSLTATLIGFYLSFYGDVSSGPAIVLTLTLFFALAFGWSRIRDGILRRGRRRAA
ncbi:MAG: metal ABC transporter permease [Spirochaetales bacterium]|nr:metal ABC transporter permease [Spirochaetales bacterium]